MNLNMNFRLFAVWAIAVAIGFGSCQTKEKTNYKYNDNTARIRLAAEPDRLNPILSRSGYARQVHALIFGSLLDFDPVTLELTPFLVKSQPEVTFIEDGEWTGGTSFTYELKEEARWDDGTPVTADDVEFSLKLVFAPGLPNTSFRPYFEFFKVFEKSADNPKKFTLIANNRYILNEQAAASIPIYQARFFDPGNVLSAYTLAQMNAPDAEKKLGEQEDLKKFAEQFNSPKYSREKDGVSGSGAYKFETWETGQYILLTKKKDWWGKKFEKTSALFAAAPDTILFKIIPDQAAALTALKDQEIDAATSIDANDFEEISSNAVVTDNYNLHTPLTPQIYMIYLNNKHPKLSDKRTRRALAHLMNVDDFINALFGGLAERVTGPIMPTAEYYNKNLTPLKYDQLLAADLLQAAGWTDTDNNGVLDRSVNGKKEELELDILITSAKASQNIALYFQNALKSAGIKLNVVTKEAREAIADVRKKDYQIYAGAIGLDLTLDDPKQQWHSESDQPGGGNYAGISNTELDAVIDELRTTTDRDRRNALYMDFQSKLYEEQPVIFLFAPKERIAVHRRFDTKTSLKRPGIAVNTFRLDD